MSINYGTKYLLSINHKIDMEKIKGGVVLHTANLKPDTDCILELTLN